MLRRIMEPPSQSTGNPRSWWPIGVAVALALFAAVLAALMVIALGSRSDLVAVDYYEQELRYQEQIERLKRAGSLSEPARFEADLRALKLRIHLPPEHVRQGLVGRIRLYRPSSADLDRRVALDPGPEGVHTLDLAGLRSGAWDVQLTWRSGTGDYYAEYRVVVPPERANSR